VSNCRIDGARLWASLEDMAEIGPGLRGGCNRQSLTDEDRDGRLTFKRWCEAAGLTVTVDAIGNMFARREGVDSSLPPLMLGSHLDTQPTGGRYDGVLGVLGALEVVRTLNDLGIRTRHPIEVVNWTNEEGARFAPAMLASGVFAGVHDLAWAYDRIDSQGLRFEDELHRIGFKGDLPVGGRPIHAMLELHIEQGPILEREGKEIGVVTHGQGLKWLQVTLTGKEAHTGSTPMSGRADAGLGAARIVDMVHKIAWMHAPLAVGTVGATQAFPNSRNVIQGKVVMTVDFRHPDAAVIGEMEASLREGAAAIAAEIGLGLAIETVGAFDPVAFDTTLCDRIRACAGRLGYGHRDIVSGAGHDACFISRVAPTAMVMCPCVDGLSHNEDERITMDWAVAGADVLLHAALETAEVVEG
jgi:N-carbamoyl-L-amino-acid hydrolase